MTADPATGEGARFEICPLCAGTARQPLFLSRGFRIVRCTTCGLAQTQGVDDATVQYPPFDQRDTVVVRALRAITEQLLRERRALVVRRKPGGRLLDFGCGNGAFARTMARAGYDVVGIEPFSLGRAVTEPGLRLWNAPLRECRDELGVFDVITLWQVLEHVRNPAMLLDSLLEHLRPDGVMIVSVPNFASWQSHFFGPSWFHLDPPRHLSHFDRASLASLLARAHLEILAVRTFHLEYGPIGWLQSAINRVLPRPNFLFEFVKDRGALNDVSLPRQGFYLVLSIALAAVLAVPALAVEALAACNGAGAVLTCSLRRDGGR